MKTIIKLGIIALLFSCTSIKKANAQTDKPYKPGPVWQVNFVQTKPGMGEAYLKDLSEHYVKVMEEAKKEGVIMDYKIMTSEAATPNDWNIMFLIEVPNFAALDGMSDKMDAIDKKIMGSTDAGQKITVSLNDMREFIGTKLTREMIFK
jgi:hypothetical protein